MDISKLYVKVEAVMSEAMRCPLCGRWFDRVYPRFPYTSLEVCHKCMSELQEKFDLHGRAGIEKINRMILDAQYAGEIKKR